MLMRNLNSKILLCMKRKNISGFIKLGKVNTTDPHWDGEVV